MSRNATTIIMKRELGSFFFSPIAYIIIALFLVVSGWFFFSTYFLIGRADMRDFFGMLPVTLTFTVPALTMRAFSEEYRSGSYEILGTLPVTHRQIILGKFLGILSFAFLMILPTFLYAFSVSLTGVLNWGPVWGGYAGALFLLSSVTAIGIFMSSLTKNQIAAFIATVGLSFFFFILDRVLILLPAAAGRFFQFLSTTYHFRNIARGVLDSRDILYFSALTFLFLYATKLVLDERR